MSNGFAMLSIDMLKNLIDLNRVAMEMFRPEQIRDAMEEFCAELP